MVLKFLRIALVTFLMYFVTHLFVFLTLPIGLLVSFIDQDKTPRMKEWFSRCLFAIVGKRVKVVGRENIIPGRGYVIVSNYPSFYAGFALIGVFPAARVVAHGFLRRIPLLGQVLPRLGTVFVEPGSSGRSTRAIELGLGGSNYRQSVIILPEGRRTSDGRIHRFRRGFVYILRRGPLDLLPVTLNGFYRLKPVGRIHLDPDAEPEMIIHPGIPNSIMREWTDEQVISTTQSVVSSVYRP